jgi:outer membrane immunogenic protein
VKAAPIAPLYAYDWTGVYLGLDIGGDWVQGRFTPAAAAPFNINAASFMGGGFVGYNRQYGAVVVGLEGDVQGVGVNKWDPTATYLLKQNVLAAINGRLGYAFNRTLLYVIGGVAFTDAIYKTAGVAGASYNAGNVGFDIGAGLEYALVVPNWTVRAEYRYYDFGTKNAGLAGAGFHKTENTFRVGVAYKFGAPDPVPVVARY